MTTTTIKKYANTQNFTTKNLWNSVVVVVSIVEHG